MHIYIYIYYIHIRYIYYIYIYIYTHTFNKWVWEFGSNFSRTLPRDATGNNNGHRNLRNSFDQILKVN